MKHDQFVVGLVAKKLRRDSIEDGHNEDFPFRVRQMKCKRSCPDLFSLTLDQFFQCHDEHP